MRFPSLGKATLHYPAVQRSDRYPVRFLRDTTGKQDVVRGDELYYCYGEYLTKEEYDEWTTAKSSLPSLQNSWDTLLMQQSKNLNILPSSSVWGTTTVEEKPKDVEYTKQEGALVGYRTFSPLPSDGYRWLRGETKFGKYLHSTGVPYGWVPGVNVARHNSYVFAAGGHAAPAPGCSCGFYARYDPMQYMSRVGAEVVIGAVEVTGRIIKHETGMRCENARILSLIAGRQQARYDVNGKVETYLEPTPDVLKEAGAYYQVPVFDSLSDMQAHAREFGVETPWNGEPASDY